MGSTEDLFDKIIENRQDRLLHKADTHSTSAEKDEILSMLKIVDSLKAMPKNPVPEPFMRRKYLTVPAKSLWLNWLPVSKMAGLSMSFVFLFTALAGTGYAAFQSVPGETLFSIKKSSEQLRIKFASSPEERAVLQMEVTKRRLNEAKKILKKPNVSPKQEKAAIKELVAQTKSTIEVVENVALASPVSQESNSAVASLESITKIQQELLEKIKPGNDLSQEAISAIKTANENSTKVSEIKKIIEAASLEQSLAELELNPNAVTITGSVSLIQKLKITVEKTSFSLNEETVIRDGNGQLADAQILNKGAKVKVAGYKSKNDGEIIAKHVTLITTPENDSPPAVNGGPVLNAASSTDQNISPLKRPETARPESQNKNSSSTEESMPATDNTNVTGSFIFEDPSPQTAF